MTNTCENIFAEIAKLSDEKITSLMGLFAPLWSSESLNSDHNRTLATCSSTCLSTTGSALILIENGRVWDAALLMRSVLEGSVRFIYMLCDKKDVHSRLDEFANDLEEVAWLELHKKVSDFLNFYDESFLDDGSKKTAESMLLSNEEYELLSSKYSKTKRRVLRDKWNLGRLLNKLVEKRLMPPAASSHYKLRYLKTSHSIHSNPLGLASFYERAHRQEPNKTWANYAHAVEVSKDLCDLCLYRLFAVYLFLGLDFREILETFKKGKYEELCAEILKKHHSLEYGSY